MSIITITVRPVTYGSDDSMARFSVSRYQHMIEAGILTPRAYQPGDDIPLILDGNVVGTIAVNALLP